MNLGVERRRTVAAYPYYVYLTDTHVVEVKKGGHNIGIYLITPTSRRRGVVLPLTAWIALQNAISTVNLAIDISQGQQISNNNNYGEQQEGYSRYDYNSLEGITGEWGPSYFGDGGRQTTQFIYGPEGSGGGLSGWSTSPSFDPFSGPVDSAAEAQAPQQYEGAANRSHPGVGIDGWQHAPSTGGAGLPNEHNYKPDTCLESAERCC